VSPTYEASPRFERERQRLSREHRRAFREAVGLLVSALRDEPPAFPPKLRVKRVQGHPGVWELSFAPDGRDLRVRLGDAPS